MERGTLPIRPPAVALLPALLSWALVPCAGCSGNLAVGRPAEERPLHADPRERPPGAARDRSEAPLEKRADIVRDHGPRAPTPGDSSDPEQLARRNFARDGGSRPPGPEDPSHQQQVLQLLRERRQPSDRLNYVLGPGDKIDVRVQQMPELTGSFVVSEEGEVVFPLLGSVHLAGLSEQQGAQGIRERIAEFVVAPDVALSVSEFHGAQVSLIGAVGNPGVYALRGFDETIADLLTEAGGISPGAGSHLYFAPGALQGAWSGDGSEAAARLGLSGPSQSFGGKEKATAIDLTRLNHGAEVPELGIPLRGGDVILVPLGGEVYVDGWVNAPGGFSLSQASTLTQAIANAGGMHFASSGGPVTLQRADSDGQVKTYRIDYRSIVDGKDPDFYLDTGDKIRVASNPIKVVPWAVFSFFKGIVSYGVGTSQTLPGSKVK